LSAAGLRSFFPASAADAPGIIAYWRSLKQAIDWPGRKCCAALGAPL
jgi:hypothetical protein